MSESVASPETQQRLIILHPRNVDRVSVLILIRTPDIYYYAPHPHPREEDEPLQLSSRKECLLKLSCCVTELTEEDRGALGREKKPEEGSENHRVLRLL